MGTLQTSSKLLQHGAQETHFKGSLCVHCVLLASLFSCFSPRRGHLSGTDSTGGRAMEGSSMSAGTSIPARHHRRRGRGCGILGVVPASFQGLALARHSPQARCWGQDARSQVLTLPPPDCEIYLTILGLGFLPCKVGESYGN
jgi:hypothetical protein